MILNNLTVRELQQKDIELITNYWLTGDPDFFNAMGYKNLLKNIIKN